MLKHKHLKLIGFCSVWLLICQAGGHWQICGDCLAQSVCLPAPRLLVTTPLGGQQGTTTEVIIAGEYLEQAGDLLFSHPGVTALPKVNEKGEPVPLTYQVTIAENCPVGIYEARVVSRLGVSSARAFTVGDLPEISRTEKNTSLETSLPLTVNSICNAAATSREVDYYSFSAEQNQRIIVDCAAQGIDSKLKPVVIVADKNGQDLQVERRGGMVEFLVPETDTYIIKIHDLTYNGGPYYYYRLAVQAASADELIAQQPATRAVSSYSWPPTSFQENQPTFQPEAEPNNAGPQAKTITLPCAVTGSFFPAADVDYFEFTAQQGETWWIEIGSARLGIPTDPALVVQQVKQQEGQEIVSDVLELSDIASPIKISSNGYAYDGPPYNSGTSDFQGKLEIKETGTYRLRLTDLFGGTRNDPNNIYQLVIRQAEPDFALVSWAMHMELRNGDRNALSKPIALRRGVTMPLEVVAFRRDGFDGEIQLSLGNLPAGVTATGLTIPAGKHHSIVLITASDSAPHSYSNAIFQGRAVIDNQEVTRPCQLASMTWPVTNAWAEIPNPRLIDDVPVSVCEAEGFPISIAASEQKVWETFHGEKLTIPLVQRRRGEFSGKKISLKTFGTGFEKNPAFDIPLDADTSETVLDLATLKTPPGDYTIAFYGSAVAKYRYCPEMVDAAQARVDQLQQELAAVAAQLTDLKQQQAATEAVPTEITQRLQEFTARQTAIKTELTAAEKELKQATDKAKPADIADIIVSEPISIRVLPPREIVQK